MLHRSFAAPGRRCVALTLLIATTAAFSAGPLLAQAESAPCCYVARIDIDPAAPINDIVTIRDRRTGETFSFGRPATLPDFQLRQAVGLDPSRQFALAGGQRLRLVATPGSPQPAQPAAAPAASAPAQPGFACTRLNANGRASPEAVLTVNVNGTDVATFDSGIYGDLERFMRPGPNVVRLTFSGASRAVQGELRCLAPEQRSSRNTILSLRPTAARLTAEARVNLVAR